MDALTAMKHEIERLKKENASLKTVPMKYRRMQFNASLQNEVSALRGALMEIGDYSHAHSAGPSIPDTLWVIREMAYKHL